MNRARIGWEENDCLDACQDRCNDEIFEDDEDVLALPDGLGGMSGISAVEGHDGSVCECRWDADTVIQGCRTPTSAAPTTNSPDTCGGSSGGALSNTDALFFLASSSVAVIAMITDFFSRRVVSA